MRLSSAVFDDMECDLLCDAGNRCVGVLPCPERAGHRVPCHTARIRRSYLVVDRFNSGSVYRETEIERTDLETIISDFMTGQFNDPVRVVAFNTLEHWADDVSKDVAQEDSDPVRHCGRARA